MTKHPTITGFVAIALLAVAVTAATIRPHSPLTDGVVVSAGKFPTANFDDRWSAMSASTTDTAERSLDVR